MLLRNKAALIWLVTPVFLYLLVWLLINTNDESAREQLLSQHRSPTAKSSASGSFHGNRTDTNGERTALRADLIARFNAAESSRHALMAALRNELTPSAIEISTYSSDLRAMLGFLCFNAASVDSERIWRDKSLNEQLTADDFPLLLMDQRAEPALREEILNGWAARFPDDPGWKQLKWLKAACEKDGKVAEMACPGASAGPEARFAEVFDHAFESCLGRNKQSVSAYRLYSQTSPLSLQMDSLMASLLQEDSALSVNCRLNRGVRDGLLEIAADYSVRPYLTGFDYERGFRFQESLLSINPDANDKADSNAAALAVSENTARLALAKSLPEVRLTLNADLGEEFDRLIASKGAIFTADWLRQAVPGIEATLQTYFDTAALAIQRRK